MRNAKIHSVTFLTWQDEILSHSRAAVTAVSMWSISSNRSKYRVNPMMLKEPCSILGSCPSCHERPHTSWGSCHAVHPGADFKPCWNFRIWFGKYQDRKNHWDETEMEERKEKTNKQKNKQKTGREQRSRKRDLGRQKAKGKSLGKKQTKREERIYFGESKK